MISAHSLEPSITSGGGVGWVPIVLNVDDVPESQTDIVVAKALIPYRYRIEALTAYVQTLTGTTTVASLRIGAAATSNLITAAAAGTTTAAPVALAFSALGTPAARTGAANSSVAVGVTTAAASTLDNLTLVLWIRPFPMRGEAG